MSARFVTFTAFLLSVSASIVHAPHAAAQLAVPAWMKVRDAVADEEGGAALPAEVASSGPVGADGVRAFRRASWAAASGTGMLVGGVAMSAGLGRLCRREPIRYSVPLGAIVAAGGVALATYGTWKLHRLSAQRQRPALLVASTAGRAFLMTALTTITLFAASVPEALACSD